MKFFQTETRSGFGVSKEKIYKERASMVRLLETQREKESINGGWGKRKMEILGEI